MSEFMHNPCPITFRVAVPSGLLPRWDGVLEEHRVPRRNVESEVIWSPDRIAGIFSRDSVRWIVLAIQETGDAEHPVAIGAGGIAAEGDGEPLERQFLLCKVEAFHRAKAPDIFRANWRGSRWRRYCIGRPERSEPGVSVLSISI